MSSHLVPTHVPEGESTNGPRLGESSPKGPGSCFLHNLRTFLLAYFVKGEGPQAKRSGGIKGQFQGEQPVIVRLKFLSAL